MRLWSAEAFKILAQAGTELPLWCRGRELFAFAACGASWRYCFTSLAEALSCVREIPGSSAWTCCFSTLGAPCCCVNHPPSSGFESDRADDAGRDWLPYAGRALGEGRAAVLQQQSLGCVFASSSEEKSPDKAQGYLSARKKKKTNRKKKWTANRSVWHPFITMMRWERRGCLLMSDVSVHIGNVPNRRSWTR